MSNKKKKAKRYCIAYGCLNSDRNEDISMFRLPADLERCREWLPLLNREDLLAKTNFYPPSYAVCEAHFDESSFKKGLKRGSTPMQVSTQRSTQGSPQVSTQGSPQVSTQGSPQVSTQDTQNTEERQDTQNTQEAPYIEIEISPYAIEPESEMLSIETQTEPCKQSHKATQTSASLTALTEKRKQSEGSNSQTKALNSKTRKRMKRI